MSDITKFTPAAVDVASGLQKFDAARPQTVAGGVPLLKLSRHDGSWSYGQDEIEVEEGAEIAINVAQIGMGFVDWKAGKPVQEKMAIVGQDPINPGDLPPPQGKDGWTEQVEFGQMVITTGTDKDQIIRYKTNSYGGKKAFNAIFDAIKARAAAGLSYNPVVVLDNENYTHAEYGVIYNPIFTVVGWVGEGSTAVEAADEEEADEKPKRRQRRAS